MDGRQIAAMIDESHIVFRSERKQMTFSNESACAMLEHAIEYLSTIGYADNSLMDAVNILYECHKAIGPYGQIPSWESEA